MSEDTARRAITFTQYDEPPLKTGEYTITVHQKVPSQPAPNDFPVSRRFAVSGERFTLDPSEIAGVYPPDLANGEYAGDLPHVLVTRRTLPWERASTNDPAAPWLALLLFNEDELVAQPVRRTVRDLVPEDTAIVDAGSASAGKGTMPAGYVSYPGLGQLEYGEAADDDCMTIDVDADLFSKVAPAPADLPFLAHLRESDTQDTHDTEDGNTSLAVVLGNRVPRDNQRAHVFLVSIENLGSILPTPDGKRSVGLTASKVRLVTYRWWTFTADAKGKAFAGLVKGLVGPSYSSGRPALASLQVPFGPRPDRTAVENAMRAAADGKLGDAGAAALAHNAYSMGYLPVQHHMRRGGKTVSWYRGPLAPTEVTTELDLPLASSDAALRYDPQTGMFDVSYAAAWQIGRLLALQNESFTIALYNWRRRSRTAQALAAEHRVMTNLLGGSLESVTSALSDAIATRTPNAPPEHVVSWLARLSLLKGVPFNYLVPDERMLPPESLRVFHLDRAWMNALLDGAFSIGRATSGEHAHDAQHRDAMLELVDAATKELRSNARPATNHTNTDGKVTGFLLRSEAVAGWPHLNVFGYADAARKVEVPKLRFARVSNDIILCLFDGAFTVLGIHEHPGQLHCGVEGDSGKFITTLRAVDPPDPGLQYLSGSAPVGTRNDKQTLTVAAAATSIKSALSNLEQTVQTFTSAEFALQMIKGVVEIEFASR